MEMIEFQKTIPILRITKEEIEKLVAIAPRFGIEIRLPVH
jgi:hypothetical protein